MAFGPSLDPDLKDVVEIEGQPYDHIIRTLQFPRCVGEATLLEHTNGLSKKIQRRSSFVLPMTKR